MQPCGKPCGSSVGFDFLNVEVIQVEKKAHLSQRLNLCQWSVTSSIRGRFLDFESTERLQETLKLSLNRRTLLSSLLQNKKCRTMLRGFMQNHAGLKNMCKKTRN